MKFPSHSRISHLRRNAAVRAVLYKETSVDLTFVDAGLLVAAVNDVVGAGGLLQHADLVGAASGIVVCDVCRDGFEVGVAEGVVDFEGAG